ncbi:MAG: 5-(carboxyamino)imidazole ribonucleotide mutase [Bacteroidetes bacterium]|nr:5-(carboxyamino)imidazole ribonucleotide mutase [Bacteroidota bacterium]
MKDVLIIMGSDSDLPVMKEAAELLDEMGITYHLTIVSAHRTVQRMFDEAKSAQANGYKCVIAGAGGAAHLPGMFASITPLPVIGVPIKSSNLSGLDSLYSIVQMPPGIPVATMAINGAKNAGLFAAKIIANAKPELWPTITNYMTNLEKKVLDKAESLEDIGFKAYLSGK